MAILCVAGLHATRSSNVSNQGYYFSKCARCDCEMIGSAVKWKRVPRGFRVVWRAMRPSDSSWLLAPILNLPMVIPQTARSSRRRRPRFSFAELVASDLRILAWSGANGLKLWHSNLVARIVGERGPALERPVIRMG